MTAATSRARKTVRIVAAGLLAMLAAICATYWYQSHARYRVVGKLDPKTGVRFAYTVSNSYSSKHDPIMGSLNSHSLDAREYSQASLSGALLKLEERAPILGRILPGGHYSINSIHLATYTSNTYSGYHFDPNGYLVFNRPAIKGPNVSEQHLVIHGCPVTWCCSDIGTGRDDILRFYWLVLREPHYGQVLTMLGCSKLAPHENRVLEEMIKMRDSITVETRR